MAFKFIALPSDVLILVMQNLAVAQLGALATTCQFLNALVSDHRVYY